MRWCHVSLGIVLVTALACDKPATSTPPAPKAPTTTASPGKPSAPRPQQRSDVAERVAEAQAALGPLKKSLQQTLKAAMAKGPEQAVLACNTAAPTLTSAAAKAGVQLGRTSHKLRNESNAQADWMKVLYARLREGEAPPAYLVATLPDGSFGYVEPIVTQPLCLTCHGDALPDGVRKIVDEKYPHDAARGFSVGELRGAWWAVLPAHAPEADGG